MWGIDSLSDNIILESIQIPFGTESFIKIIKTGNQIWLYIRLYSGKGSVTIPERTILARIKPEYTFENLFGEYLPIQFLVIEREIENKSYAFTVLGTSIINNIQMTISGNSHSGLVRIR